MAKTILEETKEKVAVETRLHRKYPQMYKPGWGKVKKKSNWVQQLKKKVKGVLKPNKTVRHKTIRRGLERAGLTEKDIGKLQRKR